RQRNSRRERVEHSAPFRAAALRLEIPVLVQARQMDRLGDWLRHFFDEVAEFESLLARHSRPARLRQWTGCFKLEARRVFARRRASPAEEGAARVNHHDISRRRSW